jgi:hypothetical protein
VGSSLNYSSSWSWLENHFHNEVTFMLNINMSTDYSTQPAKFLADKLVFHLEILLNITLKLFPYLDDGSISDLLRSCPRMPLI